MNVASLALALWLAAPAPESEAQAGQAEAGVEAGAAVDAAAAAPEHAARSRAYEDVLVPLPEAERDEGVAKALMNSAKVAFKDDRFEEAIELLAQAYRSYPYVTLLYSLGSAHRRAYELGGDVEQRTLSIRRYQQYLSAAPDAEYSTLAQNYLTTLLAERDLGDVDLEQITRLLVSTSADDAVMIIDDGAPLPAPGVVSLAPGPHSVVVSAPGYFVFEREVDIPEGTTYPVQVDLLDMPGRVAIEGPKQASVSIDGRSLGRLPLARRVSLEPGEHQLVVTKNGRDPFVQTLEVERDTEQGVFVELEISRRRYASYFLLGLGTVGIATSTVLGSLALERQARALALDAKRETESWTTEELETYDRLRQAQIDLRGAAFIAGVAGSAVVITGIVLFVRDKPRNVGRSLARRFEPSVAPGGFRLRF